MNSNKGNENKVLMFAGLCVGSLVGLSVLFSDVRTVTATAISNAITGCFAILTPSRNRSRDENEINNNHIDHVDHIDNN